MDLKAIREKLNMTQVDVAKKCEVSISSYRLWEAGVTTPNEENMKKLKEVLGVK